MKVQIRPFKAEDIPFIVSCWVKSSYKTGTGYMERPNIYHKGLDELIKKRYEEGSILAYVACLEEDADLILGFAVFGTDYTLHFIYVKEAFKRQGISKALLSFFYKSRKDIKVSFWTKDIKHIQKNYSLTYDRFRFFK